MKTFLAIGSAAVAMFSLGVFAGATVSSPARLLDRAIKDARDWEAVAMQWKSNSDRFEAVARDFRQQALQLQDGFLVCNSMLPVEKRM